MKKLFKPFMFIMIPLLSVLAVSCHDEEVVDSKTKPSISAVSPDQAVVGTQITITGTNLRDVSSVKFGSVDAQGFDAAANTATTITATVPAGVAVGEQKIAVSSPGGTAEFAFTVLEGAPVPAITGISPQQGPVGSEVTIAGTNLGGTTQLMFGDKAITDFTATAGSIVFIVPESAALGAVTLNVTTPGGQANIDFTVSEPVPTISSFSPDYRVVGGKVTVKGKFLNLVTSVWIGNTEVTDFTPAADGTSLSFRVPEGALTGVITLKMDNGYEVSTTNVLTVQPPDPFIFNPTAGPVGTEVTLSGIDFSGVTFIKVGSTVINNITVADDGSSVVFTIPSASATGKITAANKTTNKSFFVVEEGLLADFDANTMLWWPQNGQSDWGWGIPDQNITNTAEGIEPNGGYFALINTLVAPARAWATEKAVNLVSWYGYQIFPEAPKTIYDPAAPISDFVAKMDVAVAQPSTLEGLELLIRVYNAQGIQLTTSVKLADVVASTGGSWHNVSIPLSNLANLNGTKLTTYGDLLAGGIEASDSGIFTHHFAVVINNSKAEGTEPIPVSIAIDNIRIEKAN